MPYSIQTKDGIEIDNIPDDIAPDSDVLKQRVAKIRAELSVVPGDPDVPTIGPDGRAVVQAGQPAQEMSMGDIAKGAGEAGATMIGGMVFGIPNQIDETLKAIGRESRSGEFGTQEAANRIAGAAASGARDMTYAPRTQAGKDIVGAIGKAAEVIPPVIPMAQQLQGITGAAAMQAGQAARLAPSAVKAAIERAKAAKEIDPSLYGDTTAGAAAVPVQQQRVSLAQNLPIPIDLSKREITGSFEDARFELETAKNIDAGAALREASNLKNRQLIENLEAFIDETGAGIRDVQAGIPTTEFGQLFTGALETEARIAKRKYQDRYDEANASPEGDRQVSLAPLIDYINEQGAMGKDTNATVLGTIGNILAEKGAAYVNDQGRLVADRTMPLRNLEEIRKKINVLRGTSGPNTAFGVEMKRIIDGITEESGGDLYRSARAMKVQFHNKFTDKLLVKKLTTNKKDTLDRQIAYEDVAQKVMSGSRDDVAHIKKILQNAGREGTPEREAGLQAWREMQGQVMQKIFKEATKNIERTEWNDPYVSAKALNDAIASLEKGGKLDLFFGARGAAQIRDLNEVAKFIKVAPRGSFNTSNTATVLLAAIEALASPVTGAVGLPPFVLTGLKVIKDQRAKQQVMKKVKEHVEYGKKLKSGDGE